MLRDRNFNNLFIFETGQILVQMWGCFANRDYQFYFIEIYLFRPVKMPGIFPVE